MYVVALYNTKTFAYLSGDYVYSLKQREQFHTINIFVFLLNHLIPISCSQ